MKQYQTTADGTYQIGPMSFTADKRNMDYLQMRAELDAVPPRAELLLYVAPECSAAEVAKNTAQIEQRQKLATLLGLASPDALVIL